MTSSAKINQIYDAIDSGAYKQALKLIRASEARFGCDPVLLALRAITLQRLGRIEECLEVCELFLAQKPIDPSVLDTMNVVFKSLHRPDWNRQAWEAACQARPKVEQLHQGLYFAHLREWSYLRMQQVAMSLYRLTGQEKYARWAALCIEVQNGALLPSNLLKASAEQPDTTPTMNRMLQIAELLLVKHDLMTPMSAARLRQYIRVLRRQGSHEKIIGVIDGFVAGDGVPSERLFCLADALHRTGRHQRCIDTCLTLLNEHNADDWRYLQLLIDSHFAMGGQGAFDSVRLQLLELRERHPRYRGPKLALIAAQHRRHALDASTPSTATLLIDYFGEYGAHRCYFNDVQTYLAALIVADRNALFKAMQLHVVPSDRDDAVQRERRIRRRVSMELCARALGRGADGSVEELGALSQSLFAAYVESMDAGTSLEPTEFGPGDDLCLLTAHTLIDLCERTAQPNYLVDAIMVLEMGLRASQHNFQFRLLLVRLYCHPMIGAFLPAFRHYSDIDTKSIQLETLSHLVQDDALRFGFATHAAAIALAITRFHNQHELEAPDLITLAYVKDHLDQVLDFIQFRTRLHQSYRLAHARTISAFVAFVDLPEITLSALAAWIETRPPDVVVDMNALITNDDCTLIESHGPDASRARILNLPAPYCCMSSWREPGTGDRNAVLSLNMALMGIATATVAEDAAALRRQLAQFTAALEAMHIDIAAGATDTANLSIDQMHWRLCFLLLETAACVRESHAATNHAIEHLPQPQELSRSASAQDGNANEGADKALARSSAELVNDNTSRWRAVQRQIHVIQALFADVVGRLCGPSPPTATMLPILATFGSFAARWATLFAESWSMQIPSQRTLNKEHKGRKVHESFEEITRAVIETRTILGAFVVGVNEQLQRLSTDMRAWTVTIKSVGVPTLLASSATTDALMVLCRAPVTDAAAGKDPAAVRAFIAQSIADSHQASIERALGAIDDCSLSLSRMKF